MSRQMLINAKHPEECRIAIVEKGILVDLEIESAGKEQLKGNIYKAPITRIEPSLQAAFLDIGSSRNGFLQINDINRAYFRNWPKKLDSKSKSRPAIQEALDTNQHLIVQVVKDEREAKGATLTTNLSIPGKFLVLMIGNQRGGVSRKISDSKQRGRLKEALDKLEIPPGMSVIVRTAGTNKSSQELQEDLDSLVKIWEEVIEKSLGKSPLPTPLFRESSLTIRTLRDFVTSDFDQIVIDDKKIYENARQFLESSMPQMAERLEFYDGSVPIFSHYLVDSQIETIDNHEVRLPSGGSIVIDSTEAVVSIDVNSGRATSRSDVEDTAFETNKEAAVAIARQLRLRDLGGLVVIDFIDMVDRRHRQSVEKTLKDAVKIDKAKVELSRISKFGLLEMSRQRLKTSIASQRHTPCPYCAGRGRIKTSEAVALEALRKIESAVYAGDVEEILIRLNPTAALFLLNEKRRSLSSLEDETNVNIKVIADGRMRQHEYDLELINTRTESASPNQATELSRNASSRSSASRGKSRNRRSTNKRSRKSSGERKADSKKTPRGRKKSTDAEKDSGKRKETANSKEATSPSPTKGDAAPDSNKSNSTPKKESREKAPGASAT